jgi:hypothetical protein
MARRSSKTPDGPEAEMAALHERRVELATLRHAAEAAASAAQAVLDGFTERRQAAISAEIDGTKGETVQAVDQAAGAAAATIADCRDRRAVIERKEAELKEAQDAVIDRFPDHYRAKRDAAAEEATAKLQAARDAVAAAEVACRAARNDGAILRQSCRRRRLDEPVEMPLADLGGAASEISKLKGSWDRLGELNRRHQSRTSLSVGEAREQLARPSEPASEPLLEMI